MNTPESNVANNAPEHTNSAKRLHVLLKALKPRSGKDLFSILPTELRIDRSDPARAASRGFGIL